MENEFNHQEEEINNPEQFQVGRNDRSHGERHQDDDSGYTAQESEFADGKGTELAEAFDEEVDEKEDRENADSEE